MQPLRLLLHDFCSHSDSELSFEDFSSAIIIGKVRDNDRFSNGAGKSTIFNAIEYVLFNEVKFSSLEKIIRDGCDVCRVEYDFISSLDRCVYRIVRSNSRKTGTDVRLFRKNGDKLEDLTQRRVSDTEKEILKILGFNYKSFCASVIFSQAGSENNVHKDFGNLLSLTPEKRKTVLREVLQLNIYSTYEKAAKAKQSIIQAELDKQRTLLTTVADSDDKLSNLTKEKIYTDSLLYDLNIKVTDIKNEISTLKITYQQLQDKSSDTQSKVILTTDLIKKLSEQLIENTKTKNSILDKFKTIPEDAKSIQVNILKCTNILNDLLKDKKDIKLLNDSLEVVLENIIDYKSKLSLVKSKINDIDKPLSDEEVCTKCHQNISHEHKDTWKSRVKNEIKVLEKEKNEILSQIVNLNTTKENLEKQIFEVKDLDSKISSNTNTISNLQLELNTKRSLYTNYSSLIDEHDKIIVSKNQELLVAREKLEDLTSKIDKNDLLNLQSISIDLKYKISKDVELTNKISELIGTKAILQHKIHECMSNIEKSKSIELAINKIEKSLLVHSKVIQAFGSNGIPALITQSILDDLQEESNKWLLKLRPGLQLQFNVINDKSDKEQEDTLDIQYFIDGNQREYRQLSGAQKIIVSLALKLGILFIINKRLGVEIKLMLLDEVDQALDDGGTEIFSDIIKIIQNELKVLVITHNDSLKHKFSHAILVEQDENNVSKGKIIKW